MKVTVGRLRYHDEENGFTVVSCLEHGSYVELTVVGNFDPPETGQVVEVAGEWRTDKRYGRQFVAESVMPVLPASVSGIRAYLAAGHVKGIGKTLAARLLDRFGSDLLRIIDEEPQRLLEQPGVGERKLTTIRESWARQRGDRDVMMFLAAHGIGGARAFRIRKQYGDSTIAMIQANPYRLAGEVRGVGFTTADAIARKLGHDERSPFRLLAGLQHVFDAARQQEGHCGLEAGDAANRACKLLNVELPLIEQTIASAIASGKLIEEGHDGRRLLFDASLHRAESRIAAALARLAGEQPPWARLGREKAIRIAEEESGIALDETQKHAIELALRSKAIVVTGGPGVGKTTLVRALLAVYESAGLAVSLAAPTGRAAKRLSESTGSSASTIHRLLELSPHSGHFKRDEEDPLETDVVIVDEASMIDVPLFDALLRAMPSDGAIVMVGDADQLPSIGPGQVLFDILESGRVPAIRLTEIHRQLEGSDIVVNAHRIHRGELPVFGTAGRRSDMYRFAARSPEEAVARVVDVVKTRIPEKFGMHPLRDVQVLAPVRKDPIGVHALNAALQEALNPPSGHAARIERLNGEIFCVHDKVMQTENNYDKTVFNGDVGIVAAIDAEEERFTVDFGADLIVDYTFDEADQLTLAYATTIHKSQGSEYEAVVIALMPQHFMMLRRNLLYTAVTRGRKLVVIVGDERAIATAVRTGRGGERITRLKTCLAQSTSAPRRTSS